MRSRSAIVVSVKPLSFDVCRVLAELLLVVEPLGQPRTHAQYRLAVNLTNARFAHLEYLADLAQVQLLVVVEQKHEALALGQGRDRTRNRLSELVALEHRLRAVLWRVGQETGALGVAGE